MAGVYGLTQTKQINGLRSPTALTGLFGNIGLFGVLTNSPADEPPHAFDQLRCWATYPTVAQLEDRPRSSPCRDISSAIAAALVRTSSASSAEIAELFAPIGCVRRHHVSKVLRRGKVSRKIKCVINVAVGNLDDLTIERYSALTGGTERSFPAREHGLKSVFGALIGLARLSQTPFSDGIYRALNLAIAKCLKTSSDAAICIARLLDGFFRSSPERYVRRLGDNFRVAPVRSACGPRLFASDFGDGPATGTARLLGGNFRIGRL
jgi:hypothetical protein